MTRGDLSLVDLAAIRLFVMDVDGVLTDGSIDLVDSGSETKRFNVTDGLGIQLLRHADIRCAWVTGRTSRVVAARAAELGVDFLVQGAADKHGAINELLASLQLEQVNLACMGDDVNDLPAFSLAALTIAPANAVQAVLDVAHLVTDHSGGHGAVREAIDWMLRERGELEIAVSAYLRERTSDAL